MCECNDQLQGTDGVRIRLNTVRIVSCRRAGGGVQSQRVFLLLHVLSSVAELSVLHSTSQWFTGSQPPQSRHWEYMNVSNRTSRSSWWERSSVHENRRMYWPPAGEKSRPKKKRLESEWEVIASLRLSGPNPTPPRLNSTEQDVPDVAFLRWRRRDMAGQGKKINWSSSRRLGSDSTTTSEVSHANECHFQTDVGGIYITTWTPTWKKKEKNSHFFHPSITYFRLIELIFCVFHALPASERTPATYSCASLTSFTHGACKTRDTGTALRFPSTPRHHQLFLPGVHWIRSRQPSPQEGDYTNLCKACKWFILQYTTKGFLQHRRQDEEREDERPWDLQ